MNITSFFRKLYKKGIKIVLKDDALNIKADSEIDPEILAEIKSNKELLIEYLKSYESDDSSAEVLEKIVPYDKQELTHIPLSFGQERLWFLDQLHGSSEEYHIHTVIRLEGNLDIAVLEQTLKTIVTRHEVLRTVIYEQEGIGYQKVISEDNWKLEKVITSKEANLKKQISNFINIPFDLSKDYMLRCSLYDLGKNEFVLSCVFHHIASDGWSSGILTNEFVIIYNALKSGKAINFPELSLQYSDYAIWQRNYFEKEILESQLSYWEENLADSSTLTLPLDYSRPSVQSSAGSTIFLDIDKKLTTSLNNLSKQEGVTLFMLLLAAFKVLLSRYSGQQDISIGTPIANRTQSDLEEMIGFFVNTLVLRSDLSGNPSFKEVLARVKKTTLDSYDNQLAPFEKVVDRVVKTRDMSTSALFQVMFTLQNTPLSSEIAIEDVKISGYDFDIDKSEFDLTMDISEDESKMMFSMTYCTDLFKEETVNRMMLHYRELLHSIVNDITKPISELSMLSTKEEVQLVETFNTRNPVKPSNQTVLDLFELQVKNTPENIATVYQAKSLTYKELDIQSNQLAHYLQSLGVTSNTLVGICLERGLDMIVGILGILKSGGAYVPIDPSYPKSRIEYMLEDTALRFVLSTSDLEEALDVKGSFTTIVIDHWKTISKYSIEKLSDTLPKSNNLAYVIYTSGSTGKPKGVEITHENLFGTLQGELQILGANQILRSCLLTNYVFDVSLLEIFLPLLTGECIVIPDTDTSKNIPSLLNLLITEKVSVLQGTPSFFSIFVTGLTASIAESLSLELLCIGGESLTSSLVVDLKKHLPKVQINNHYGPTETTIDAIVATNVEEFNENNIGIPMPNAQIYIVDSFNSLVPIGVFGELYIGGNTVSKGYLNRKELTDEKFVPNPFKNGRKLYKTGDIGRWLPNGTIEYRGRKDNQVKIRGYRIELGEIENALSNLSTIEQCCVLAKEDTNGNKRLVAYVLPEGTFDKEETQIQLKKSLPDYMIPVIWIVLDEFPLTNNGKLNEKALPEPDTSLLSTSEYVPPRDETEESLVTIWQDLLSVDKVGVYDNFFELGGHSLLVVQLISRLQKIDLHLDIKDIFSDATIAGISVKLTPTELLYKVPSNGITINTERITPSMVPLLDFTQEDIDNVVNNIPDGISNIEDMYPLSPLQEGIYFHYLMSDKDEGDPYVLPHLLSFTDEEERSAFIEALQFVVNRHDVLRTCVISKDLPSAVQVVLRKVKLSVEHLEIEASKDMLSELELLMVPGNQWMDVSKAPLIELQSADDPSTNNYYLIINQHHLVMDHVGLEKIVVEVEEYLSGNKEDLPETVSYRDFIGHTLHLQETNDSASYFHELLGNIEEPTYPFELSDVQGNGSTIQEAEIILPNSLSKEIRKVCADLGMSSAVIFHAAYGVLVGKCSNSNYALFGSLFLGRLQGSLGAADSLGLFINTLPFLTELKGSVLEYVKNVQQQLNGLLPYEQTQLSDIQNWSGISNEVPFFSALLNFRHSAISSDEDLDTTDVSTAFVGGHERTSYPFTLSVDDFGVDFGLKVQVDEQITPTRILTYMELALNQLLEGLREEKRVSDLSILTKEEEVQLLEVFNKTSTVHQHNKTLIDIFREQVGIAPESIALCYEEEKITYEELDQLSSQLANYILAIHKVNSEQPIATILERSDWLLISFLAILKTGGVYVPIDPSYPEKRKEYILRDSGSTLIIDDSFFNLFIENGESHPTVTPNIAIQPNHLAYIIYTSGSTGNPKGVMIEHTSVVNTIMSQINALSVTSKDNCLQFASPSFDASIWEMGISLLSGANLCIINEERKLDTSLFKDFIQSQNISLVMIPPAFLQLLEIEDLKGIKTLVTGGEAIPLRLAKIFSEHYSYVNAYGPTEASICATTFRGEIKDLVPIGKPIDNTQIYILNETNQLLPIGVIGELCIGGIGVARGYLNQEELKKKKFIASPFKTNERIYKTGDLARWLPDGNIEFLGRKDDQVKIRGYRIELGEIENALSEISGISNSCVIAKEYIEGEKRLIGYVVTENELDKELVEEELKKTLPDYMVPRLWVELNEMPMTSNGKIAKKALPNPEGSELSTREYVAPRNETEEQLVAIWQELLGIEKIGIYDNFFELGGHSLLATRLVSMIRKELNIEVAIKNIFKFTTIDEIVCYLEHKQHTLESEEKEYDINIEI